MCDCINGANHALSAQNAKLDLRLCMDVKTGKSRSILTVPLLKIKRSPKALPVLMPKFCVFCGEKQS